MEYPIVSIMIATYNSEKILTRTLESIIAQDYPKNCIDIMIVDGGSTDKTVDTARNYGCRVLNNPKTEPVNAKLIGANNARGKFLITLDHDEVFENPHSISLKVDAAQQHPECKVVLGSGYIRPKDYPRLNEYISEFGDPFSLFVYEFPKGTGYFERVLKKRYKIIEENENYMMVSFERAKNLGIIELCCLGTMIDLDYFRSIPDAFSNPSVMVHLFYEMLKEGHNRVIVTKSDGLVHYSADSIKAYFPKLKWRVCNNIHFQKMATSGFSGREEYQSSVKIKKYLFVPYTFLVVPCLIHALYYTFTRRNIAYMLHPFFCWYVMLQIIFQYTRKVLGLKPHFTSYDGKATIDEN